MLDWRGGVWKASLSSLPRSPLCSGIAQSGERKFGFEIKNPIITEAGIRKRAKKKKRKENKDWVLLGRRWSNNWIEKPTVVPEPVDLSVSKMAFALLELTQDKGRGGGP